MLCVRVRGDGRRGEREAKLLKMIYLTGPAVVGKAVKTGGRVVGYTGGAVVVGITCVLRTRRMCVCVA